MLIFIVGCGEKKKSDPEAVQNESSNSSSVLTQIQKEILPEARELVSGEFLPGDNTLLAVLCEVNTATEWGVRINILKADNSKFLHYYTTSTLEGAFDQGIFQSVRFPETEYDMLIYDTEDYFLGTSGGEVFYYVIDPLEKRTFYSHLVIKSADTPQLFVQPEISSTVIRNFIINKFRSDYPELVISSSDIVIE